MTATVIEAGDRHQWWRPGEQARQRRRGVAAVAFFFSAAGGAYQWASEKAAGVWAGGRKGMAL